MISEFERVDDIINTFLQEIRRQKSNVFLMLNEIDYYQENKAGTLCHYPNCGKKAINSHTYPKSFLRRISKGNKVYTTDIKDNLESYLLSINDLMYVK